jgi:peptide/nickel transport system substrate-binding protein
MRAQLPKRWWSHFSIAVVVLLAACQPMAPSVATPPKDTLTVAVTADGAATGFNPHISSSFPSRRLMNELYDGLVEKNYYDPSKPFEIGPGLATSWDISPDGLIYTFHLRQGVKFSDGTDFNADAVAFNLQVLSDKAAPGFDQATATTVAAGYGHVALMKSWRVVDPYTFELTMSQPFGGLIDDLSLPMTMAIISPAAIKQYGMAGIAKNPAGTGPFKLQSYKPGESIVLSRNDAYFRGPAGFKTLVMQIITDPVARAVALESKQVDVAEDIAIAYKDQWKDRSDLEVRVTPNPATYICRYDFKNGPTADPEFRRALSLAINRDQINQLVFKGAAQLPNSYFPSGTPGYSASDPVMTYDADEAAAIIDRLGLKGTKITYEVTETLGGNTGIWEIINRQLTAVGLAPNQKSLDLTTWLADNNELQNRMRGLAPNVLKPDALNMLCSASGTDALSTLATTARGTSPNPKVEAAFAQADGAKTVADYFAAMRMVNQQIVADNGILYILSNLNIHGLSRSVEWQPTPSQAHTYYSAKAK